MLRTTRNPRAGMLAGIALVLVACGGTPPAGTPTPTLPTSATAQPTGGQPTGGQPTEPTDTEPGQPTQPPGGGGVVFPDGVWTAGAAHLVVTGAHQHTTDLTMVAGSSISSAAATVFTYASQDQTMTFTVTVESAGVAFVITSAQYVGGGGTTADAPCSVTWARQDANAVDGTIQCSNAPVIGTGGQLDQRINIQAQFSATR